MKIKNNRNTESNCGKKKIKLKSVILNTAVVIIALLLCRGNADAVRAAEKGPENADSPDIIGVLQDSADGAEDILNIPEDTADDYIYTAEDTGKAADGGGVDGGDAEGAQENDGSDEASDAAEAAVEAEDISSHIMSPDFVNPYGDYDDDPEDDYLELSSDHEASAYCGNHTKYTLDSEGVLRVMKDESSYDDAESSEDDDVRVPKRYFAGWTDIKKICIEEGVTRLGRECFRGCPNLEEVYLPDYNTMKYISKGVFANCTALRKFISPDTYMANDGSGNHSGIECEDGMFYGCVSLEEVQLGMGLWHFGADSFYGCEKLKTVELPADLHYIHGNIFADCENLEEINISRKNYYFETVDSSLCLKLNPYYEKNNMTVVPALFAVPSGLVKKQGGQYTVPKKMKTIAYAAFKDIKSLKKVVISDKAETIENNVFDGCSGLNTVVIPGSVSNVGEEAFNGCDSLTDIYYAGTEAQWKDIDFCIYETSTRGDNWVYMPQVSGKLADHLEDAGISANAVIHFGSDGNDSSDTGGGGSSGDDAQDGQDDTGDDTQETVVEIPEIEGTALAQLGSTGYTLRYPTGLVYTGKKIKKDELLRSLMIYDKKGREQKIRKITAKDGKEVSTGIKIRKLTLDDKMKLDGLNVTVPLNACEVTEDKISDIKIKGGTIKKLKVRMSTGKLLTLKNGKNFSCTLEDGRYNLNFTGNFSGTVSL